MTFMTGKFLFYFLPVRFNIGGNFHDFSVAQVHYRYLTLAAETDHSRQPFCMKHLRGQAGLYHQVQCQQCEHKPREANVKQRTITILTVDCIKRHTILV